MHQTCADDTPLGVELQQTLACDALRHLRPFNVLSDRKSREVVARKRYQFRSQTQSAPCTYQLS